MEATADSDVDPWNRLIAMIDRNLNAPIRSHRLVIEFWRAGMRDPELRGYAHEGWSRYRAPFTRTIVEGRDAGFFAPTITPDDVVDLLLTSLSGTNDHARPSSGHPLGRQLPERAPSTTRRGVGQGRWQFHRDLSLASGIRPSRRYRVAEPHGGDRWRPE